MSERLGGADGLMMARAVSVARNWWALGLRGLFAILFGIAVFVIPPGLTVATLVLVFAAYMLVDGVFALVTGLVSATHHGSWAGMVLEGVVDVVVGVVALVAPLATILAFIWLVAAWALISGGAMVWASIRLHPAHGRWLLVLGGAFSIVGGVLLFAWPVAGAVVMAYWLGAYALVFGVMMVVAAFGLRRLHMAHGAM